MFKVSKYITLLFMLLHAVLWLWVTTYSPNKFVPLILVLFFIITALGLIQQNKIGYWLSQFSLFTYLPLTLTIPLIASRSAQDIGPIAIFYLKQNIYVQWSIPMAIIVFFLSLAYCLNLNKHRFGNGST